MRTLSKTPRLAHRGRAVAPLSDPLVMLWAGALVAVLLAHERPWLALGLLGVAALATLPLLRARRARARSSLWIELLAPAVIRGVTHELAAIVHEGPRELVLLGELRRPAAPDVLRVPAASAWSQSTPPWTHARRDEILLRLRTDPATRRCELVEVEESR